MLNVVESRSPVTCVKSISCLRGPASVQYPLPLIRSFCRRLGLAASQSVRSEVLIWLDVPPLECFLICSPN